jgi:uncharacterized protein (DUF1810 family)
MTISFNLQRFIDAQTYDYERALQEIKNGRKKVVAGTGIWVYPSTCPRD